MSGGRIESERLGLALDRVRERAPRPAADVKPADSRPALAKPQARSIAPDQLQDHFGWIGMFFGMAATASSTATRELLGWTPTGPTLLEDIAAGAYSASARTR